jgi:uncharacterized protein YggE
MREQATLQVTGSGTIKVAPDEAEVRFTVVTEGKTAADAVESNAKQTQAVFDAVSAEPNHGVTTTGLGVNPIVSYDPDTHVGTIAGYQATNGVEVKTKIGYAGQIYDAGVKAGASQSSGITFRIQNEAPHREEALRLAVEDAHREAKVVARAAGVKLDGPVSIQIDSGGGRVFYRAAALDAKSAATPVVPEDMTISASVQFTFRLRE